MQPYGIVVVIDIVVDDADVVPPGIVVVVNDVEVTLEDVTDVVGIVVITEVVWVVVLIIVVDVVTIVVVVACGFVATKVPVAATPAESIAVIE